MSISSVLPVLVILPLLFHISGCAFDFFDSHEDPSPSDNETSWLSSQRGNPDIRPNSHWMAYCSEFSDQDFSGMLTAYYNWEEDRFNSNKVWLYLWDVPYEFRSPPGNYMQIHAFYMESNREIYDKSKSPVLMELVEDASSEKTIMVEAIEKPLLRDLGHLSIEDVIDNYGFLLHNLNGWQGLSLSIFNAKNQPVRTVKALIPPFISHPQTFLRKHNQEHRLLTLHPFGNMLSRSHTEEVFYKKAYDTCSRSPVRIPIPSFEDKKQDMDKLLLDELTGESLSILPKQH